MMELANKDIKIAVINMFHVLKKVNNHECDTCKTMMGLKNVITERNKTQTTAYHMTSFI